LLLSNNEIVVVLYNFQILHVLKIPPCDFDNASGKRPE